MTHISACLTHWQCNRVQQLLWWKPKDTEAHCCMAVRVPTLRAVQQCSLGHDLTLPQGRTVHSPDIVAKTEIMAALLAVGESQPNLRSKHNDMLY